MVHTDATVYWNPTKPRINIYAFTDTTYSSPLYTYNGWTDPGGTGQVDKPINLTFESQTTTAGTFNLEIDNSNDSLDPDAFLRGNRVVIECSSDGSTWQTAFKGLVRAAKQKVFGRNNRTLSIAGYSYIIRLTERILSFRKQAALISGQTFDRSDTSMYTNNLLNTIFTVDSNYVNTVDDTQLYSIFKTSNLTSSPIDDFVPRIDAPLSTLSETVTSVLEFSNALLTVDFATDQLVLFNPDRLPTTGGAGVFLLTDSVNQAADDANYTMYPIGDYNFEINYDYPDAGNRLIGSIGNGQCPPIEVDGTPGTGGLDTSTLFNFTGQFAWLFTNDGFIKYGGLFPVTASPLKRVRIGCITIGAPTGSLRNRFTAQLLDYSRQYGSDVFYLYPESQTTGYGDSSLDIKTAASGAFSAKYAMTTAASTQITYDPTGQTNFWLVVWMDATTGMDNNNRCAWGYIGSGTGEYVGYDDFNQLVYHAGTAGQAMFRIETSQGSGTPPVPSGGTPPTTIPQCGGLPESADADSVLLIASDRNSGKRIGMVEQPVTNMPVHVKNFPSMAEYLFNKLYVTAKPRFNFSYPSVTAPLTMPKAGDLVCHVSKKAQVGRARTPIQTGVIAGVTYSFGQDSDSVLGLRKLAIDTTGILRGSY